MKQQTKIVCIIDKSGSMYELKTDSIGSFNEFIDGQKEIENDDTISMYTFSNDYVIVYENKQLTDENIKLTDETYKPNGGTALYDAIGKTLNLVGNELSALDESERPEKVLVVILTDGEENSSKEFTKEKIKEMIDHQTSVYKWTFLFLAANQDAFIGGQNLGIKNNLQFASTSGSLKQTYSNMDSAIKSLRSMSRMGYASSVNDDMSLFDQLNIEKDTSKL